MMSNCKLCLADCAFKGKDMKKGNCKGYIPMSNADRIRAMSDEELAVFLESSRGCPSDDDCEYGVHATPENCIKHWATWLQQPAKEGI